MAQNDTLGTHSTTVARSDNTTRVTYHKTVVVAWTDDGVITLDSGGLRTPITKRRMNQASIQHNLGFFVYEKRQDWVVDWRGETYAYTDGMRLYPSGAVLP